MSLLDILTGGEDSQASQDLQNAYNAIAGIETPSISELTLPQLQQYVAAGILSPAQAQAYLQQSNAFATENIPQTGTAAQVAALNQLSGIANAGAVGTPTEQAQIAQAEEQMNTNLAGQRGAIEQAAEARGTPGALVQAALEEQNAGQDAQQGYLNALNAQSNAYQTALNAMSAGANVGSALQGQQNAQANTVAQAQNAMEQFNAANQQTASESNANRAQAANQWNAQNQQNVSNENVQQNNARTAYNAQVPETVFNNQMQKAEGEAGINEKQANQAMQEGQQQAGLFSGILGAGATLGGDYLMGQGIGNAFSGVSSGAMMNPEMEASMANGTYVPTGAPNAVTLGNVAAAGYAGGGVIGNHDGCYHEGGICMEGGGMVPGRSKVPGNSLKNDTVHVMASPGEAVIPRTAVQSHLPEVLSLIAQGRGGMPHENAAPHPHDVASLLQAMRELRMGGAV